jgi:hypothetical protein
MAGMMPAVPPPWWNPRHPPPPVDRFTDHELVLILKAARDEHFFPVSCCWTAPGYDLGRRAGCAGTTST